MRETEPESAGVGFRACGTEKGVEAVDCAYAYEWVLDGGRRGLEWYKLAEYHIAEVIDLGLLTSSFIEKSIHMMVSKQKSVSTGSFCPLSLLESAFGPNTSSGSL